MKLPESLRKLGRDLHALTEIAEYLDRVGSLENAEQEARQRMEQAQRDEKEAQGQMASVRESLHRLAEQARVLEGESSQIIAAARGAAADIIKAADVEVARKREDILAQAAGVQRELSEARGQLEQLNREIAEKETHLAKVTQEIEKAKARVARV